MKRAHTVTITDPHVIELEGDVLVVEQNRYTNGARRRVRLSLEGANAVWLIEKIAERLKERALQANNYVHQARSALEATP